MLVSLLCLSSWCLLTVFVLWLFLTVPRVDLQFVIVVFPDHAHLLSIVLFIFRIFNTFILRDIYLFGTLKKIPLIVCRHCKMTENVHFKILQTTQTT